MEEEEEEEEVEEEVEEEEEDEEEEEEKDEEEKEEDKQEDKKEKDENKEEKKDEEKSRPCLRATEHLLLLLRLVIHLIDVLLGGIEDISQQVQIRHHARPHHAGVQDLGTHPFLSSA